MKIAFVVEEFPKISETFILNQITGLIDMGHEVDIFYFNSGDTKIMHSDIRKYGLIEKSISLNPLFTFSNRVKENYFTLDENLYKKIGFRLNLLKKLRRIRNLVSIVLILLKFQLLLYGRKRRRYDIIHCEFGTSGLRFLPFYRLRILGRKLIVQFRGHDLTEFVNQKGSKVFDRLFQEADCFLSVCKYLRNQALNLNCPKDKISVLRDGIDCKLFAFREREKPVRGLIKVVFVGRLVEIKGVEYGIRAISILNKRGFKVELMVVGDGLLKNILQELSRELNVENIVKFLGAKNHDEIVRILERAHLFVAPSITSRTDNQEGIPNVLKEAMAVGLPVVSTFHAGIPELVEDGVSGFLVAERDYHALADKLGFLIDHPQIWSKMGRNGRKFVEKNYDKEKLNKDLVDIYRHLVG